MHIDMTGTPYAEGDVVIVTYRTVDVGRYLSKDEAETLNGGQDPWDANLSRVRRPRGKVHYFPECGGKVYGSLARDIEATTCLHCLLKRAKELSGWRWTHAYNREEVAWLKRQLGSKVDGFEQRPNGAWPDPPVTELMEGR